MSNANQVVLIGRLPRKVLAACWESITTAGISPAVVFRTTAQSAMVVERDKRGKERTLFIRWRSNRIARVEWTLDPRLFSPRHKATSLRAAAQLLADPHALRRTVSEGGKTPQPVS